MGSTKNYVSPDEVGGIAGGIAVGLLVIDSLVFLYITRKWDRDYALDGGERRVVTVGNQKDEDQSTAVYSSINQPGGRLNSID